MLSFVGNLSASFCARVEIGIVQPTHALQFQLSQLICNYGVRKGVYDLCINFPFQELSVDVKVCVIALGQIAFISLYGSFLCSCCGEKEVSAR